jgi:hypothetical protein
MPSMNKRMITRQRFAKGRSATARIDYSRVGTEVRACIFIGGRRRIAKTPGCGYGRNPRLALVAAVKNLAKRRKGAFAAIR